jgi:CRP-like cAMP-binding protein
MNEAQRQAIGAFLRQGVWFGGLPSALQQGILERAVLRTFARGQTIQIEGDSGAGLTAILEGSVRFLLHVGDRDPSLMHVGGPGFWFGQLSVLDGEQPVVTALARTVVRAVVLTPLEFRRLATSEPGLVPAVNRIVHERSRIMYRFQAEARGLPPDARLKSRLADLADLRRLDVHVDGPAVGLDISQAELAQLVGLSRPQVNQRLRALEADGWLELGRRRILVLDSAGLRAGVVGAG